jgi:hypothetical protein
MKKKIIGILLMSFVLTLLIGCNKKDDVETNPDTQVEEGNNQDEVNDTPEQESKVEVAGWSIEVLGHTIDESLENVSVVLGYTDVGESTFSKKAKEGYEYGLVHLDIVKLDSMETIEWDKFLLTDDQGNSYTRTDDSFIDELGMKRMPGTALNFGEHDGWIAFEIKKGYGNLSLNYNFENDEYNYNLLGEEIAGETLNQNSPDYVDYIEEQRKVDENLLTEAEKGYTIDNPFVVVDPYGNSPLTAIAIFDTEEETAIDLIVKGKNSKDDITTTFVKAQTHVIPIYGLYAGDTTEVVLTFDDGTSHTLEITTDNINSSLVKGEVTTIDETIYDYTKLTFASVMLDNSYGVSAYDSEGDLRLVLTGSAFPVKRLKNGNIMVTSNRIIEPLYHSTGLLEMDLIGKVVNDYIIPGGYHHEFIELENGNLLIAGNPVDFKTVEDHIYEIDRNTGEVVYELDLTTILNPEDGGSINRTDHDWFHNNAIWYDEETDNILLSGRHADAIVAINKTNKTLSWILGDPNGWTDVDQSKFFTPIGDEFEWQYAQHEVSLLPNGDIMMFDNGAGRTKVGAEDKQVVGDDVYSRAVIYRYDTENMTIEQIWQYGKERGAEWYSSFISGAEYIDENNIWVTSGGVLYNEEDDTYDTLPGALMTSQRIAYINQVVNNELAFELVLNSLVYRSTPLSLYPENYSFDLNVEGKYLGNLGVTPTIEVEGIDTNSAIEVDFNINVVQNPDRYIVSGNWAETAEDAAVILRRSDGKLFGYQIGQPANAGGDTVAFSKWFSPVGLNNNSYDIYIRNNGILYNTGYIIE